MHVKSPRTTQKRWNILHNILCSECPSAGHSVDWTWALVVGNGSSKRALEFVEACNTTPMRVNQWAAMGQCYKVLWENWKRDGTPLLVSSHLSYFTSLVNIYSTPTSHPYVVTISFFNQIGQLKPNIIVPPPSRLLSALPTKITKHLIRCFLIVILTAFPDVQATL